jgi:hypothetical protein
MFMRHQEIYYGLCTEIDEEFDPHGSCWATLAEASRALARYRRLCPKERTFIIEIAWIRVSHKKSSQVGLRAG